MLSASGAKAATLSYDPLGRLHQTAGANGTTRLLYDGDALVAEFHGSGALLRRYVHGTDVDEPLIQYEGATLEADARRYVHADHLGSVVAHSNRAGAPTQVNVYDSYGAPGAANFGRFQFTGQIYIPEFSAYHYKARVYDPALGRFMQTDPVGYRDDNNLYAYVGNDAINNRDPSGATCERDERGQVRSCRVDSGREKLTNDQIRDIEADYFATVRSLQADTKREVIVKMPVPGADGKPTQTMRTVKVNAGSLARALINSRVVAAPEVSGGAETIPGQITLKSKGVSGQAKLYPLKSDSSPSLVRSIVFVHEAMHQTQVNNLLIGYFGKTRDSIHQGPFNEASYEMLYGQP